MQGLSIIICSRTAKINSSLNNNIVSTVGCNHELVVIDNSDNKYSIFEAYNLGIQQSKYPFLVFIHEDILIHTNGWGITLLKHFSNISSAGLIGLAGSKIKTNIPSGWWNNRSTNLVINIIQHRPGIAPEKILTGFQGNSLEEVVVIDGVFIAMRKDRRIKFNESLNGFHNYDQSISLDYGKYDYKLFVSREILIEHFSQGNLNINWLRSNIEFNKIYKDQLPQAIRGKEIVKKDIIFTLNKLIEYCKKYNNRQLTFKYWLKYKRLTSLERKDLGMIKYFIGLSR